MDVVNREALEELFGGWPSFHDAEVLDITVARGAKPDQAPNLVASIHIRKSEPANFGTAAFEMAPTHDVVVVMSFGGVSDVSLEGFNHQNVIDELAISSNATGTEVVFDSIFGVHCFFRCQSITVQQVMNNLSVGG